MGVKVRRLPHDAVIRLGWVTDSGEDLVTLSPSGWGYYSSPSFGAHGWKANGGSFQRYGEGFADGDVLTACVSGGGMAFRRNGQTLGTAFTGPALADYRPAFALRRGAEVEIMLESDSEADFFPTPEQHREMAWDANRYGITLVMFQVFFISLVRPKEAGPPDWQKLILEYDRYLGFPAPELSTALFHQFSEVHRVKSLRGFDGWL